VIEFLRLHILALARFEIGREVAGCRGLELRAQAVDNRETARRCRRGTIDAHEACLDADRQEQERDPVRMKL